MPDLDYPTLKSALAYPVALEWLIKDARDDFFPDPIWYADLKKAGNEYVERRQHRLLQIDSIPHLVERVPKKSGLLREAVWLHPMHRLLYLAVLQHLLPILDARLPSSVYSYRLDSPEDRAAYPFANTMVRWKTFHNDFRQRCMDDNIQAVVLADIASFYDHIESDRLAERVLGLLGASATDTDRAVVELLRRLLRLWTKDGFGIPQNLDPSSFFGSLYLTPVDRVMTEERRYRYLRWVDDIRICAKDKRQALRALHDLQHELESYGLFLASDKTQIIERGSDEFQALLDVEDDQTISKFEETLQSRACDRIDKEYSSILARLEYHSADGGDDRKFRAFANRLLEAAQFRPLRDKILRALQAKVIPRLRTHPDRSDYWIRMLIDSVDTDLLTAIEPLLVSPTESSMFDW